jgi:hypothetical protein
MRFQAPSRSRIAFLLFSTIFAAGCDTVITMDGHPPPDAKLVVSEVSIDSSRDSSGRTVRVHFRVDWTIDSEDFLHRTYRLGTVFYQTTPPWLPSPQTTSLPGPTGTLRDTLTCKADTCYWPTLTIHVLAGLSTGEYLSVAQRTIERDGSTTP